MTLALAAGFFSLKDLGHERRFEEAFRLMEQERYSEAEEGLRAYQIAYPDDLAGYWNLALIYHKTGQIEKARQELERYLDRRPNPREAREARDYLDQLEALEASGGSER